MGNIFIANEKSDRLTFERRKNSQMFRVLQLNQFGFTIIIERREPDFVILCVFLRVEVVFMDDRPNFARVAISISFQTKNEEATSLYSRRVLLDSLVGTQPYPCDNIRDPIVLTSGFL